MDDIIKDPFLWILAAALVVQLGVYLLLFRRLAVARVQEAAPDSALPPVSVVIAAQNEEDNLRQHLPLILEQDYPNFEVIVVDDQSEDDTKYLLEDLEKEYPHLRVIPIKLNVREFAGKKFPLTLGFKSAKYDILLLTDADCRPTSRDWIRHMATPFTKRETEFVLGFSPYEPTPGALNSVVQFDTFYTALQYFSFALGGDPYMGVGRNLAYRKEVFFRNKGFAPYLKVISGDDDLFVNQHARGANTAVQLHPDSFMLSEPKRSFGSWIRQKGRHMQTGKLYRPGHRRALGMLWLANVFFYAAVILGAIFIDPFWIALAALGLRWVVQGIIWYLALKKLRMVDLLAAALPLDIFWQLLYMPVMGLVGIFRKGRNGW